MVGTAGFALAISSPPDWRINWATLRPVFGVNNRISTGIHQVHDLGRLMLRYVHHSEMAGMTELACAIWHRSLGRRGFQEQVPFGGS